MRRSLFVFLLLLAGYLSQVVAQTYSFRRYTVDQGLNSNTVYSALQDSRGFMWFGTQSGACRFDGKNFERFTIDQGLSDNEILSMQEDREKRIWFSCVNGSACYFFNGHVYNPDNDSLLKKIKSRLFLFEIYEDRNKNLWIFNKAHAALKVSYPGSNIELYSGADFAFEDSEGMSFLNLAKKEVTDIHGNRKLSLDSYGKIVRIASSSRYGAYYILSDSGILKISDGLKLIIPSSELPSFRLIYQICEDHNGDIWIASALHGAQFYRKVNGKYQLAENFLEGKSVSQINEDAEHNIWFTTLGSGIYLLTANYSECVSYTSQDHLYGDEVYAVYKDGRNKIWLGQSNGTITCLKGNQVKSYQPFPHISPSGRILRFAEDDAHRIFAIGDNGMVYFLSSEKEPAFRNVLIQTGGKIITATSMKDLEVTETGHVMGTYFNGLLEMHWSKAKGNLDTMADVPFEGRKRNFAVFIDKENNLWYSDVEGLKCYKDDSVIALGTSDPLLSKRIIDIGMLKEPELMVISTDGFGIALLEDSKVMRRITEEDGLPSNACGKIFIRDNTVWVATNLGLSRINFQKNREFQLQNYTVADGLLSNQINDVYAQGDTAYIATSMGLTILSLKTIKKKETNPEVYITKVLAQGQEITQMRNPSLGFDNKYLQFEFIAPTFTYPEGVRYQYQLSSKNSEWVETRNTALEFPSLNAGNYTFSIRAKKADSDWGAARTFNFSIAPPFYESDWFIVIAILAGGGIAWYSIRQRFRRLKQQQTLALHFQNKINHLENQALQAMMNPHFIFNSLNAIQHHVATNNPSAANKYLTRFARLIRKNLEAVNRSFITLEEEIERLNLYLETEALRLQEKLQYSLDADESLELDEVQIPSMILQPFVENAIWHGIMPLDRPGEIKIRFIRIGEERLMVCISDNGIGIKFSSEKSDQKDHKSFGVKITRERLQLIERKLGKPFTLQITDLKEKGSCGTQVTIEIPVLYSEHVKDF